MYRAEIDGLRAIAIIPVVFFHAGLNVFSGGFVGVDVFFVISGYLITTILIADLEQKQLSLISFYERRARRILPALFFVVLACIPFACYYMIPSQMKDFSFRKQNSFSKNKKFFKCDQNYAAHSWVHDVHVQYTCTVCKQNTVVLLTQK